MRRQPPVPKHLDEIARRKWKELVGTLPDHEQGTLDLLTVYCAAWSAWLAAGNDQDKIRWTRVIRQAAGELKLTPKSRKASARHPSALLRLTQDRRSDAS
jgi:phage terminase small subunit